MVSALQGLQQRLPWDIPFVKGRHHGSRSFPETPQIHEIQPPECSASLPATFIRHSFSPGKGSTQPLLSTSIGACKPFDHHHPRPSPFVFVPQWLFQIVERKSTVCQPARHKQLEWVQADAERSKPLQSRRHYEINLSAYKITPHQPTLHQPPHPFGQLLVVLTKPSSQSLPNQLQPEP